ncbi:hypothetical protein [Vibrio rumoiensis]|uniref:hypothetical protein n=1 Tax=Vibrio rumoiensis TaxID=76258 RepID=UPI00114CB357|nr:hypothetical protein [Vibrio rumoiensis]
MISTQTKKSTLRWPYLLLTVLALIAGFYLPSLLQNLKTQADLTNAPPLKSSQYCALSTQACKQDGAAITLDTDIARPLTETRIHVDWPEQTSDKLMLTLRGLEMDLGIVKFPIIKQSDGSYSGSIVLPICTDAKMTWIGSLTDNHQTVYTSIRMEK